MEGRWYCGGVYLFEVFEVVLFRTGASLFVAVEAVGLELLLVSPSGIAAGKLGTSSSCSGSGEGETVLIIVCGMVLSSSGLRGARGVLDVPTLKIG